MCARVRMDLWNELVGILLGEWQVILFMLLQLKIMFLSLVLVQMYVMCCVRGTSQGPVVGVANMVFLSFLLVLAYLGTVINAICLCRCRFGLVRCATTLLGSLCFCMPWHSLFPCPRVICHLFEFLSKWKFILNTHLPCFPGHPHLQETLFPEHLQ